MKKKNWDAVIVGTGFGGSFLAYQLARAGLRVLLLERGDWVKRDDSAWSPREILIDRRYKCGSPYEANRWRGRSLIYADVAVGGNSVFYGAASLRLRANDFRAGSCYGEIAADGLSFTDWPCSYEDLWPYYDRAEAMLGVAGEAGADPCEPPRTSDYPQQPGPYSAPARMIVDSTRRLGLQPFPLPLAINYGLDPHRPACIQCTTCDLFPCKISAKNDLSVTLLREIARDGADIRTNAVAKKLCVHHNRITGVDCVDAATGETFTVSAGVYILSAGAIESPRLLLHSGLGEIKYNGKLIGRYLLRHCNGIVIGIFPFKTNPEQRFNKQVAITDYYHGHPGGSAPKGPWGMLQALQVPPPEYIASQAPFPIGAIGAASTRYHCYLLCIAEDLPQARNRVRLHAHEKDVFGLPIATVHSRYHQRDLAARQALYRAGRGILREAGALIRVHKPINTYSHAIGTCRFGTSPETAVLDPHCNFFGVKNLFVVDGSFMPSAGSVNPSLTIAANALRVGEYLVANWQLHAGDRRKTAAARHSSKSKT